MRLKFHCLLFFVLFVALGSGAHLTGAGVNTPAQRMRTFCYKAPPLSDHAVILLVEDLDDDVELVRRAFAKAAVQNPIHVVRSGEEALKYLGGTDAYSNRAEHPLPELILLDLRMPGMDGFEVLAWIRAQPGIRTIPVVVLTSSDLVWDVNRAYELGASSFLVKPMDFHDYAQLGKLISNYWLKAVQTPESFRPRRSQKGPPKRSDE